MSVTVTARENDNVIVVTYTQPWNPEADIAQASVHTARFLEQVEGTVYRIDDLTASGMTWNTFLRGIAEATRQVPGSMVDERVHGILVGEDDIVKMASESMKQEQYGSTETPMFTTLHEAIAYTNVVS